MTHPSPTFAGRGSKPGSFWTPERDHALLEAHAAAGPAYSPVTGLHQGVSWTAVELLFEAATGQSASRSMLNSRWRSLIRDMEVDLALTRAVINMADAEAAKALTPPPVPVAVTWPGLMLPVRASIAPSQERMHV